MSLVKETHFQTSIYPLKVSKETSEQDINYAQSQKQKYHNKAINIFLVSYRKPCAHNTPPASPCQPRKLDCWKNHMTYGKIGNKNSNFLKEIDMLRLSKYIQL